MGTLSAATPKPLLELGGELLIERHLRRLRAVGIRDVVINLSYRGEQIRAVVGDGGRFDLRVRYSDEPEEPLETAGGIVKALPLLGEQPFLIVNADIVSDFDFAGLSPQANSGTLVLVPNPAHHPEGDYGIDRDSRLTHDKPRYTFAGISLLSPKLFEGLTPGRRPLSPVFEDGIAAGALSGLIHSGLWIDVGTPERLAEARAELASRGNV